jgi:uroporphyrinogen-III synthase
LLTELGARVTLQPAMETLPAEDWSKIDPHLHDLANYSWIVFTSPAGVEAFMGRLFRLGYDARHLGQSRIASVGMATSEALQRYALLADRTPQVAGIEYLAPLLIPEASGAAFLFVRNEAGRIEGIELLASHGAKCVSINVYEQRPVLDWPTATLEVCREGRWNGILVTSANIAERACELTAPYHTHQFWFSISPRATEALRACGCTKVITASSSNFDSLVAAILSDA